MKIDMWNKDEKIAYVDCYFYPNGGYYAGNLYSEEGKPIGDFYSKDSVEIEKRFPGVFGD